MLALRAELAPPMLPGCPAPKYARPVPVTPAPRPVPDAVRQEMARSRRAGAGSASSVGAAGIAVSSARRLLRLTRSGRFRLRRMPHWGTASLAPRAQRRGCGRIGWPKGPVPVRPHRLAQRPGSGSLGSCVAKWPRPVPWAGACAPVAPPRAGCGLSGPPSLVVVHVAFFRPVLSAAFPGISIVAEALRPLLLCLGSSHRRRDFCHWQSSAVRPPAVAPLLRLRSPPA